MASGQPLFLITEIRLAFRQCALQRRSWSSPRFGSSPLLPCRTSSARSVAQARHNPIPNKKRASPPETKRSIALAESESTSSPTSPRTQSSHELIPRPKDERAVGTGRTVDAPMKIIPQANITPNLRLSPQERLHIEILTRRAPPVIKQVKPYKERLLIYHHGNITEIASIFLKVMGLLCAGAVTLVIVPAHYSVGHSLWLCGGLLLAGWFPSFFFHYLLRPMVTRIHLRLPPNARVSPQAAMAYAKSLPAAAQVDISFTRITSIPATVTANVSDLQPISKASRWPWQFANIKWTGNNVNKGTKFRPNPTAFLVNPDVGAGRARRDVVPGIWPDVYSRLMGVRKDEVSRWKRA